MNQLHYAGLFYGILLLVPVGQVRSQIVPAKYAESVQSSDEPNVQNAQHDHSWWVNLGAGPALIGNTFAMNGGMVYCYQFKTSMISARLLGVTNNNPTVQSVDHSTVTYKMADYGILYGPMWKTSYGYVSVGAGIGLVRAGYETSIDISTNTSISLPIDAQWFWRFTSYAGIGLETYATLNFEKPFYGVLVCAQLGAW
jgi:hypothetical protein